VAYTFALAARLALGVTSETTESRVRVASNHLMLDLLGEGDTHLRQIESTFPEVRIVARGNEISLAGDAEVVQDATTVLNELLLLIQEGERLDEGRINQVVRMVRDEVPSPSGVLTDGFTVGRGRMVRAKTRGQHEYIEALRENTVTFGIGPAGTGKTYLAMAAAVESLVSGAVRRIVLTRPAVEAGERLGFLPGDQGRSLSAPALRRTVGHAGTRGDHPSDRTGNHRDSPARLYARTDVERLFRDPG
jgi:phosphate starvation-inducible PhoH-like protein